MSALSIQPPFPIFTDTDGSPLENGYIWLGATNLNPQTSPITAYWDAALTIPATQPIRTLGGYPSNAGTPGRLYVDVTSYSILVQNKNGTLVYSAPAATEREIANNISYTPGPDSLLTATDVQAALDQLSDDEDGSSYVGFLQAGSGAVTRTAQSKMRDVVSVKDFGAVGDGVADDTEAFRQACLSYQAVTAATANRAIYVPAGKYKLTDTVYIHAGNVLFGAGMSTYIDASGFSPIGTNSVFKLGWYLNNGVPTQDTAVGDLPPEIYGMFTVGGPGGGGAVVDLTFPGGIIHDMWFSAPGTGIILAGGNVFDCLIDGGLTGITVNGANQRIDNVQIFNPNFGISLNGVCADTSIQGCSFEYVKYEAISVNSAGSTGVKIVGCNFFYNEQYATISGAIRLRNSNQAVNVASCQFTNMKGPAIILEQAGTNKQLHVQSCVFNGEKSLAGYAQSVTSAGIYVQSGIAVIESCRFISLRGYALQLGSVSAGNYAKCTMQSCEITATDPGIVATDLGISSTQYGDSLMLNGVIGSGLKMFPANLYCYPQTVGLQNWFQLENVPGTNFIKLPVTHGASFHVKMRVNTLASGSFNYIKNIYEIIDVSTGWNGSTQESQIDTQVIYQSPTTGPVPDITLTAGFTSIAGPTTLTPPIVGDIIVSWPDTYGPADLDIQIN